MAAEQGHQGVTRALINAGAAVDKATEVRAAVTHWVTFDHLRSRSNNLLSTTQRFYRLHFEDKMRIMRKELFCALQRHRHVCPYWSVYATGSLLYICVLESHTSIAMIVYLNFFSDWCIGTVHRRTEWIFGNMRTTPWWWSRRKPSKTGKSVTSTCLLRLARSKWLRGTFVETCTQLAVS